MELVKRVENAILKYDMIQQGDLVIVGVSGGPDSLALLHVLNRLKGKMSFKIHAAHLDHSFRGKEAEEEGIWVQEKAWEWGIPCTLDKQDVPGLAEENGLSPQDAGHQARREFYLNLMEQLGARKVAQGHQANDQAETLIMHFLTGAGPEGLQGILPVNLPFIRPLIHCYREEIEDYCREEGLDPRRDPSNRKNNYLRNKVRNILLPWLQENINPNIVQTLNRTADVFQAEEEEWQERIGVLVPQLLAMNEGKGKAILTLEGWLELSPAVQRRVLRRVCQELSSFQGPSYHHVEALRDLTMGQVGRRLPLPGGLFAEKTYKALEIFRTRDEMMVMPIAERTLVIPGDTLILETGQVLRAVITPERPQPDDDTIFIPYQDEPPLIKVRSRQEGDRISPRGLKGSKKLKEYFIEKKIPRKDRDKILLIAQGYEILWIPGLAVSSKVNLEQKSSFYLVLKILENETVLLKNKVVE